MAVWTREDVRAYAPEFSLAGGTADATIDAWIVRADRRFNAAALGDLGVDAGALLTAHLMTVASVGPYADSGGAGAGASGAVSQVSVGDVSVSYESVSKSGSGAGSSAVPPEFASTKYGVQYWGLVVGAALTPQVV